MRKCEAFPKLLKELKKGNPIKYTSEFDFDLVRKNKLYPTSKRGKLITSVVAMPFYDTNGELMGYIGQVQDITERKKAEIALEESEERFRSMIEHSADAITLLDAKGKVLYESPILPKLSGYEVGERIGKSGFEVLHHEDLPKVKELFGNGEIKSPLVPLYERGTKETLKSDDYKGKWHRLPL